MPRKFQAMETWNSDGVLPTPQYGLPRKLTTKSMKGLREMHGEVSLLSDCPRIHLPSKGFGMSSGKMSSA